MVTIDSVQRIAACFFSLSQEDGVTLIDLRALAGNRPTRFVDLGTPQAVGDQARAGRMRWSGVARFSGCGNAVGIDMPLLPFQQLTDPPIPGTVQPLIS
jgi:hypothetical protein